MNNFYILDRNAVATIKASLAGDRCDQRRLKQLKSIDVEGNFVSSILSIIEGQSGRREDFEEIQKTARVECEALKSFYKNARTDFHLKDDLNFAEVFSNNIEHNWANYLSVVGKVQQDLYQPMSEKAREQYLEVLVDHIKQNGVHLGHPVSMCCISLLYGSKQARKILKPKKNHSKESLDRDSYNAVSDLLLISRLAHIRLVFNEQRPELSLKLLSFDNGLRSFFNYITLLNGEIIPSGGVKVITKYSPKLFSDLTEGQAIQLLRRIESES